jgi:hypothetical protein
MQRIFCFFSLAIYKRFGLGLFIQRGRGGRQFQNEQKNQLSSLPCGP